MQEENFGKNVVDFYESLTFPKKFPQGVKILNPFEETEVKRVLREFYTKYFNDSNERVFIFGINPGRVGSGVTGIQFTDVHELRESCEITHDLHGNREITAQFMYEFIGSFGGPEKFYKNFYLTSICPVGFTRGKKNLNTYDDGALFEATKPFIVRSIKKQKGFGAKDTAIILGTGKNQKFFKKLNDEFGFFKNFVVLEHPRYIMQYKGKHKSLYIKKYQDVFESCL